MRDGGGFAVHFVFIFFFGETFGVCKKPALSFLLQLEVSLCRVISYCGHSFFKACPPIVFHFPPQYPSGGPWEKK